MAVSAPMLQLVGGLALLSAVAQADAPPADQEFLLGQALFSGQAELQGRVRTHLVDLPPEQFAAKRPGALSGGQAQRVGVARALAANPAVLLMDEPFGALDPLTRRDLQGTLRRIQRETAKTIVFVTHDIEEALRLGDRIALLRAGRLVQCGTPLDLLRAPADGFVRDFMGGAATGLYRLALLPAAARAVPGDAAHCLPAGASLRDALELMLAEGVDRVGVAEGGTVALADLLV